LVLGEGQINQDGKPVRRTKFAILVLLNTFYHFFFLPPFFLAFFLAMRLTSVLFLGSLRLTRTQITHDQRLVFLKLKFFFAKRHAKNSIRKNLFLPQ